MATDRDFKENSLHYSFCFYTFVFTMEGLFDYSLWGLFLASFLAATVVPFSSEFLLTYLIANGTPVSTGVMVATAGNFLGGMSSFAIGYMGKWEWIEKYLRIKQVTIEKWHNRLYKRGAIFAFLTWVPAVGDIFAVGLGILRANIWTTALAMLAGKLLRYVIWAWLSGLVF